MGERLCVVVLTEPKHPPRHGPASAVYERGRGNILAEALMTAGHSPVMWWDHPEGPLLPCEPDLVLLRSSKPIQLERARRRKAEGILVINDPDAHEAASDKGLQERVFCDQGVAHPRSGTDLSAGGFAPSTEVVVKPRHGSSGTEVRLSSLALALGSLSSTELVQERLHGVEYRVTVVGGSAVAWAVKTPEEGEFRGNLRQGAQMHDAPCPSRAAESLARAAVNALGLEIGGVDLMMTPEGPVVIEVNAATTLYGASRGSTTRVLNSVVTLVERSAASRLA